MELALKEGEWIVHEQYGVGQVRGIEKKNIGGQTREYFRVKISTGFYWLPIKRVPEHVRSVASKYKLGKALSAMREKPSILPKNYKVRNKEVAERVEGATLQVKGELIRDLHARRFIEGVNISIMDERNLNTMRQQFALEMAVILDIEQEEAEDRMDKALKISIGKL